MAKIAPSSPMTEQLNNNNKLNKVKLVNTDNTSRQQHRLREVEHRGHHVHVPPPPEPAHQTPGLSLCPALERRFVFVLFQPPEPSRGPLLPVRLRQLRLVGLRRRATRPLRQAGPGTGP